MSKEKSISKNVSMYPTDRRVVLPSESDVNQAVSTAVSMCHSSNSVHVRDGLIFLLAVVSGNRREELLNLTIPELIEALNNPERVGETAVYRVFTTGKTGESILRFTEFHVDLIFRYLFKRPLGFSQSLFVNLNPDSSRYGRSLSLTTIYTRRRGRRR